MNLTPEKARIFRITHRDNVSWILGHGLHCKNSNATDPRYVAIGNAELIDRRARRAVDREPGGTLSDYVPFYFTPYSPMLYNIKTGHGGIRQRDNEEIVILVSSLRKLSAMAVPFLFTDRHAYLAAAQFYSDLERLDQVDWRILQTRDFSRDPDDLGKFERYQAEALVYRHMPIDALAGMVCYNHSTASELKELVAKQRLEIPVIVRPGLYFS